MKTGIATLADQSRSPEERRGSRLFRCLFAILAITLLVSPAIDMLQPFGTPAYADDDGGDDGGDGGDGGDDGGDDGGNSGGRGFGGGGGDRDDDDDDDDDGASQSRSAKQKFSIFGSSKAKSDRKNRAKPTKKRQRKAAPAKKKKKKAVVRPVLVVLDLPESASSQLRREGFTVLSEHLLSTTGTRVHTLRISGNMSLSRAKSKLQRLGAVTSDINGYYTPQAQLKCSSKEACDFRHLAGWTSDNMRECTATPRIGLVETHVQIKHPALAGQKITLIDVRPPGRKLSGSAHGTGIAALLIGADGSQAKGLLPGAELVVATPFYRVSNSDRAEAADIIRAIDVVVASNPHVLSLSLAGPPNAALERVLQAVRDKGIPVVAAAGNGGPKSQPLYPAAYETTVAVTAVASDLRAFRRASRGEHVDFAAPGVDITVADGSKGLTRTSGTSFAVPFVAASLAVMRQQQPAADIDTFIADLASRAKDLGKPGKDPVFGWGLADASRLCVRQVRHSDVPAWR